uniref:Reverse transcriptase domain-containing protein n=1 Tax=Tanacetum cinerariifolium TaxID=118510 RepID=A0A699IC56_TANCI|nr:hypothetical protein [Tanacetum cinerariifolium]
METGRRVGEMLRPLKPIPLVGIGESEGSDDYTEVPFDDEQILRQHNIALVTPPAYTPSLLFLTTMEPATTLLIGDEIISTTLARENDKLIKSSVDYLVLIPRESEVTSVCDDLECDIPVNTPLPTTDVMEEDFDIKSPLGEYVEFEDISSLDLPELTPVIDESTFLVTLPLPCTDVLGDAIIDIDLLLGEHLDTLLTGDSEIDFNPSMDIEELECLLADDPVPVPRVFDEPFSNSDSMSRSYKTRNLFEELNVKFSLDNLIPTEIYDMYHDSEGDILYFEQLLNADTSSDVSSALLPT